MKIKYLGVTNTQDGRNENEMKARIRKVIKKKHIQ